MREGRVLVAASAASGGLEEVVIRGEGGYMAVYSAGAKGVLAVSAPMGSNLGLIHLEARNAARAITQVLS